MRNLRKLDRFRVTAELPRQMLGKNGEPLDERFNGAFVVRMEITTELGTKTWVWLKVLASADGGWDHVSVSCIDRCPTWHEMELAKRLFFEDDETAMQLHVPRKDHINNHPFCLHLWRPRSRFKQIPMPPKGMV